MKITFPERSLVLLMGASGSGKSTFARQHFLATEVLSSDHYRAVVADDESDQSATKDAFEVLHYIAAKRLAGGRLTVIDATNVQPFARESLLKLAQEHHFYVVIIALNVPEAVCHARNQQRPHRQVEPHVVSGQVQDLEQSLQTLKQENIDYIYILNSAAEIDAVEINRQPTLSSSAYK
ncbi:MAG: putative kinase [Phormidesmis priestleyi Ana]|uniref:Putative kinase n=1 Tax=Phormidesmis priestleyi Ana TaxID=1666911 RepID=A0A0N8KN41_9CYAN|nr:MAG: putative kinase [Phormidesmis priestleyi Ana]